MDPVASLQCAFSVFRKEAEEFDQLPPEEAKKRLKVLLGKMDRNMDEQIDK